MEVAQENSLKFGEDIRHIGSGGYGEKGIIKDNNTIVDYLVNNSNRTQNVVMFTSGNAPL